MSVKPEILDAIAERCNRLPEVAWDRCVIHDEFGFAGVYGWITRDDGHLDFVVLSFTWGETTGLQGETLVWFSVGFTTSSAKYSPSIHERLGFESEHTDCQPVGDVLAGLNVVGWQR